MEVEEMMSILSRMWRIGEIDLERLVLEKQSRQILIILSYVRENRKKKSILRIRRALRISLTLKINGYEKDLVGEKDGISIIIWTGNKCEVVGYKDVPEMKFVETGATEKVPIYKCF